MGIRGSSTCELIFENVKVPKENLLGEVNKGFKIAMATLDGGRIGIAAQALGIAEGALDAAVEYVKTREQFGRPIAAFQNTKFTLADMKTRVEAARYLVYSAACAKITANHTLTKLLWLNYSLLKQQEKLPGEQYSYSVDMDIQEIIQ